jgi:predicted XRE-type DNA-binding protein
MSTLTSSTFALRAPAPDREAARRAARSQLQEMSKVWNEQGGLLNYAQAALVLDVSTKRVSELVRLEKLKKFEFLGRPYVSLNQVCERADQDLRAGRPRRSIGQRVANTVIVLTKTDSVQARAAAVPGPKTRRKKERKQK